MFYRFVEAGVALEPLGRHLVSGDVEPELFFIATAVAIAVTSDNRIAAMSHRPLRDGVTLVFATPAESVGGRLVTPVSSSSSAPAAPPAAASSTSGVPRAV